MDREKWFNKPGEISRLHDFVRRISRLYSNGDRALEALNSIIDAVYKRQEFNRLPAHYQIANIKSIARSTIPYAATKRDIKGLNSISLALTQTDYEFTGNFHKMFQALSDYKEQNNRLPNAPHFNNMVKKTLLKNKPAKPAEDRGRGDFSRLTARTEEIKRELEGEVEAGHRYIPDISGEVRPDIFKIWTKKREKGE